MAKPDDRMARGKWPEIAGAALPRMYPCRPTCRTPHRARHH